VELQDAVDVSFASREKRRRPMKYVLPLALIVGFATPSFAASEYFVVRGPDKKCKVVETRPTDKTMVVIGNKAFVTRDEAEKQITVLCKE
jgi:hypothetical protein